MGMFLLLFILSLTFPYLHAGVNDDGSTVKADKDVPEIGGDGGIRRCAEVPKVENADPESLKACVLTLIESFCTKLKCIDNYTPGGLHCIVPKTEIGQS